MLDKIQKKQEISDDAIKRLRKKKLIEGRKPNFHISSVIANITDEKSLYIKNKGLDDQFYIKLILNYLEKFGQAKKVDFEDLLMAKLPEVLTEKQKIAKIRNILQALKRKGKVTVSGKIWTQT